MFYSWVAIRSNVFGKKVEKLGNRSSDCVGLQFEGCRVPAANMLGPEGGGFKIAMKVLDKSRPGIAAQALGIATEFAPSVLVARLLGQAEFALDGQAASGG